MNGIYLLIGGNLGEREKLLQMAKTKLVEKLGAIEKCSAIYETASWGNLDAPSYLNQAIFIRTLLEPFAIMEICLSIEKDLGRKRRVRWENRPIDIDILFYNREIMQWSTLEIPHPRIHLRRFVLVPLVEIAPTFIHPVFKQRLRTLLKNCSDKLEVVKYSSK